MKFDGSSWTTVGAAGFSAGMVAATSLAFSLSGEPHVAYKDYENSRKATVMKFDGSSWIAVGSEGFSAGDANYTSLAFSQSGKPYVAYMDNANSDKITVMYYDAPTGVDENQQLKLSFYPNPSFDKITINKSINASQEQLFIINLSGKQLLQRTITEPTTTIDISTLPSGIYVVKVVGERGVQVGKFVKY